MAASPTWLLWALSTIAPDPARMHLKQHCKLLCVDCEMEDVARILANGMGY
jgi:hypothetical protein